MLDGGGRGEKKLLNYKPCTQTEQNRSVVSLAQRCQRLEVGEDTHGKRREESNGRYIYFLKLLWLSLPASCSKVCES